jgi:hypothetical protein
LNVLGLVGGIFSCRERERDNLLNMFLIMLFYQKKKKITVLKKKKSRAHGQ